MLTLLAALLSSAALAAPPAKTPSPAVRTVDWKNRTYTPPNPTEPPTALKRGRERTFLAEEAITRTVELQRVVFGHLHADAYEDAVVQLSVQHLTAADRDNVAVLVFVGNARRVFGL